MKSVNRVVGVVVVHKTGMLAGTGSKHTNSFICFLLAIFSIYIALAIQFLLIRVLRKFPAVFFILLNLFQKIIAGVKLPVLEPRKTGERKNPKDTEGRGEERRSYPPPFFPPLPLSSLSFTRASKMASEPFLKNRQMIQKGAKNTSASL